MKCSEAVHILLAEDDRADVELMSRCFRDSKMNTRLDVVFDGEEALHVLRANARYSIALRPDLILLDLGLPRMGGFEVLEELKCDERLRSIPVVIMSSSIDEYDIRQASDLQASCYIGKPIDAHGYADVVHRVQSFWFGLVQLPQRDDGDLPSYRLPTVPRANIA